MVEAMENIELTPGREFRRDSFVDFGILISLHCLELYIIERSASNGGAFPAFVE